MPKFLKRCKRAGVRPGVNHFSTERELSQLAARGRRLTPGIAGRLASADVLRLGTSRAPAKVRTGRTCLSRQSDPLDRMATRFKYTVTIHSNPSPSRFVRRVAERDGRVARSTPAGECELRGQESGGTACCRPQFQGRRHGWCSGVSAERRHFEFGQWRSADAPLRRKKNFRLAGTLAPPK